MAWVRRPANLSRPYDADPLHELVARWSETVATPCLCGDMLLATPSTRDQACCTTREPHDTVSGRTRFYGETP